MIEQRPFRFGPDPDAPPYDPIQAGKDLDRMIRETIGPDADSALVLAVRLRRRPPYQLMAVERDLGAWECCGFVSVPELKTCPVCGAASTDAKPKEKAMSVRCKFKLSSMTMREGSRRVREDDGSWKRGPEGRGFVNENCMSGEIEMSPVYANDDPGHENSKFWDASPSGSFKMSVNNLDALKQLEVGKEYYIDINPAA